MKGDTPLDYAEFQLSQSRTRCELLVSAEGVTEKLASGFLKPFLTHLRAAEDQVGRGCQSIRLELRPSFIERNERTWFTKGTIERFVRFVSTPEVLERVRTIEDELTQLQLVRKIQASSLTQTGDRPLHADGAVTTTGDSATDAESRTTIHHERNGAPIMARRYPFDICDDGAEASKRELLRAMDVRLLALQQEENTAFSRAAAAGFDSDNVADLMAFAENFGANRLREACVDFIALFRKRYEANSELDERGSPTGEVSSSGSDMSLASATGTDLPGEFEVTSHGEVRNYEKTLPDACIGNWESDAGEPFINGPRRMEPHDSARGWSSMDGRKRWGPPEKFHPDHVRPVTTAGMIGESARKAHSNDQRPRESSQDGSRSKKPHGFLPNSQLASDVGSGQGKFGFKNDLKQSEAPSKDGMFFSQLQQMAQKVDARRADGLRESMRSMSAVHSTSDEAQADISNNMDRTYTWHESTVDVPLESSSPSSRLPLQDHASHRTDRDGQCRFDANRSLRQRSSSPKRSTSPLRKVEFGHSGTKHAESVIFHSTSSFSSQEHSSHDRISNKESEYSCSDTEDHGNSDGHTHTGTHVGSSSEPARRLSVQDAINLFESKKRDSSDGPNKRLTKQESCKGLIESGNSSLSKKAVLRRWSGANELSGELSSQQDRDVSEKQTMTSKAQADILQHSHEKNTSTSTDGKNASLIEATAESQYRHQEGLKESSDSNPPSSFKNVWPQLQHNPKPEIQSSSDNFDRQLPVKQRHPVGGDSSNVMETDWRKQFKLELAKSLAREVKSNDLATAAVPSKSEDDNSQAKKTIIKSKSSVSQSQYNGSASIEQGRMPGDTSKNNSQSVQDSLVVTASHSVIEEHSDTRSRTTNKSSLSGDMPKPHSLPVQDSSTLIAPQTVPQERSHRRGQATSQTEPKTSAQKEVRSARVVGENKDNMGSGVIDPGNTAVKIEHNAGRESLSDSWNNTSFEFNMQALVSIVDHHHHYNQASLGDDGLSETQRGRFYERYSKLRDAKLREEQASKRAEREAKLKAMEENLDKRKAEMEARTARLSRKNNSVFQAQLRAEKFEALKASLLEIHKKQDREEEEETDQEDYSMQMQDQTNTCSSPTSPSSTPCARDGVLTSKPHAVKKGVPTYQKSATTPRSSNRVASSLSPRSVPKNPAGNPSAQRRSAAASNQTSIAENSLARSVPCFTDLKKESAKPSPARTSGSRVYSKNNSHSGRLRMATEAIPLEVNGNLTAASASSKEDKKQRSMLTRKSCATISELKVISAQGQEGEVLASLKVQKEETPEPSFFYKVRRSAVAPTQEAKPFLRKGHGIGPGAGPGVMKLKASTTADDVKSSDEEAPSSPTLNAEDGLKGDALEGPGSANSEEGTGSETDTFPDTAVIETLTGQLPPEQDDQPETSEIVILDGLPDSSESDRICHTISFPIDSIQCKQEDETSTGPLLHLLAQSTADSGQSDTSFTASSSFRASSLPHEHMAAPFSPAAASPSSSSILQSGTISGHFSPPSVMALDSPLGSPASWNSSQIQYVSEVDVVRARKTWGNPQKPVMIVTQQPPKEHAKGLKRLLKFGRKSRASETATTDWVSASTTSEGDDDPDETRDLGSRSADDLLRRARMQGRSFEFGNTIGSVDSYGIQDQGTLQSLRSSIPAPPANFKLREDHLSGGTLLKAPRSFFSLSSFRSKGSEGKSR